ncbi:MAG: SDR family NAD(P)-dependent oxidoreductase [Gammaproteobacteria bacterium]|nr:SDR family NAD(P)-dependent oxidoreductase [Gammaproteobacteria bacterium]
MNHPAIAKGRVAVVTGGASGIGLAAAGRFLEAGMRVCLADRDGEMLDVAKSSLGGDVITVVTNVADLTEVQRLKETVLDVFGEVAILMNNAGTGGGGGSFSNLEGWQRVLGVNLWGVIHGLQTFTETMIEQARPCAIINTGSKQGITNPPGDAAYNVSKAGIRTVSEHLAHELRNIEGCQVSAHLLVPGFTYTGMVKRHVSEKPAAAWTSEQVADALLHAMALGDFYVICPDNDVTPEMDQRRIQWNTDDLILNRPALSRWHPEFERAFGDFMKTR